MLLSETKVQLTPELEEKAKLLSLAGDPTRIRIFCFMYEHKEACVSDIAGALDMSVAAISHHLQLMKEHGLFDTERVGQTICYSLVQTPFIKQLKKIIC